MVLSHGSSVEIMDEVQKRNENFEVESEDEE